MALVTSAEPFELSGVPVLVHVFLNGGTVKTEQRSGGVWRDTGDTYSDGSYRFPIVGAAKVRFVCTGAATVEVPE